MPKVIIVGGGVHGTSLSHAFIRTGALDKDEITVLDPHPEPLALWKHQTRNTGMSHLRSPSSHNIDIDFHALRNYARRHGPPDLSGAFIAPYARPALSLFNEHSKATIQAHQLSELRRRGRAERIEASRDGVIVHTDSGHYTADYAILAVGRTEMPHVPRWARGLEHPAVRHIFASDLSPEILGKAKAPVVVGGGVTAAQTACHIARLADTHVLMLARAPLSVEQFDSEPCYIGPRCLQSFLAVETPTERRRLIDAARRPGTVPWDVARALEAEPRVRVIRDEIAAADPRGEYVRLHLAGGAPLESDLVVLATGFDREVPLAGIVAELSHRHGLSRGPQGFPVPDRYLRWHPRVLLSGSLAELELGPAAPNIIGAHLSARRLVPFFAPRRASQHREKNETGPVAPPSPGPEIAWTPLSSYPEIGSPKA